MAIIVIRRIDKTDVVYACKFIYGREVLMNSMKERTVQNINDVKLTTNIECER